jgi:DNA-directed RNA polymerase beta' subunit
MEGWLPGEAHVREWSSGALASAADLDSQVIFGPVRSFRCECGRYRGREYRGLTCPRCGVELVHASARRTRVGLLVLPRPLLHPWYAPAAATLLGVPIGEVLAEPASALRARLATVDLVDLARQFKHEIVTAPKARLADEAGRKLALIDAFTHAIARFGAAPASLVLDVVLVAPPEAHLGRDTATLRSAYARVFEDPTALADVFNALG